MSSNEQNSDDIKENGIQIRMNESHIDADADNYLSADSQNSNNTTLEAISEEIDDEDGGWLDNPKRICFITLACLIFAIMTLVIVLQLYSDDYQSWISLKGTLKTFNCYAQTHKHIDTKPFIVSPTDKQRSFDFITLSNGLDVLLISDKSTDKSAAAMDVGVGSSSDPLRYLGLAHFHEHMLFLGSETFPNLDDFSSYISMNGGRDNAYTDNKHTNFFFEVDNDHFNHSLDIFSHFFIDPLLSKTSMNHEVNAVDNEYKKDIPSQQWRDFRMMEYSANPKNDYHKFTVGSLETLSKNGADNVYNAMIAFHDKWVRSNLMKCVIYGRADIETLKKWAKQKFSHIKANKSLSIQASKLKSKQQNDKNAAFRVGVETGQIYYIETIGKQKQITFFWGISGMKLHQSYRSPILSFINNHLLESATNNSLYNVLKIKLLYVSSMNCDIFYDEDDWSGNAISFELTDRGEKHIDKIGYYLFKYLNLLWITAQNNEELNGIYNIYFDESKCMNLQYFNFYPLIKKGAYSVVSGLAKRMQLRQKEDLLYLSLNVAPNRLIFNLPQIMNVLQFMKDPNNVIMHYTNDRFDTSNFDQMEPFFKIRFAKEKIEQSKLDKWSMIDPFDDAHTHSLSIPSINPYILEGKSNKKCNMKRLKLLDFERKKQKKPKLILNEPSMNVWYFGDSSFKSPRINANILLISPLIYNVATNALFAEIWLQFINFYSSEWYYSVSMASYSLTLSLNHQGIVLSVSGLNEEHLLVLIEEFIQVYMTNINKFIFEHFKLSKAVLKNILINLQKTYKNINYDHVWTQANFAMSDIVKIPHFDRNTMLKIVENLLFDSHSNAQKVLNDVFSYVDDVLSNGFLIEALIHGNICKKNAMKIMTNLRLCGINIKENDDQQSKKFDKFGRQLIKMKHMKLRMKIEKKEYRKFVYQGYNSNEKDTNDVVQLWYQFGSNSFSKRNYIQTCKVLLLARMMKSECFGVLRTKEALGYVATAFSKSSVGATNNINYLVFMVASGSKSAHYLDERVAHFVNEHYFKQVLTKMDEEKFQMYVNGTINDLKQKYLRLSEKTALLWDEIIGHTYFFEWKHRYVEILDELTLKDMIRFYEQHILGKEAKWISIQLFKQLKKRKIGHRIIAQDKNEHDVLYFNQTKDLQNLGYAQYFSVF